MTVSASEGLKKHLGKRHVLISRASSIGMHRYSGIWTGDNSSWWSHLELNVKMLPSLNMSGFYYVGADTGGFGGNASGELLTRWMQLSIFTPLLRNHSAIGCAFQEPYSFGDKVTGYNRELIKARYMLLPYLYSEMLKAHEDGGMMFIPLSFEFFGNEALIAEDQILFGEELMLSPVVKSNAKGRHVYLPEEMALVDFNREQVMMKIMKDGVQYLPYELDDLKFFLRRNRIMPYVMPSDSVKNLDMTEIQIIGFVDTEASYTLYDDDGESYDYEEGRLSRTKFYVRVLDDKSLDVRVESSHPSIRRVFFTIMSGDGEILKKEVEV
jgi:alpha-glucosidase